MTHGDKVKFFQQALSLIGIAVDLKTADLITTTYEVLQERGGKFNLKDASKIKAEINDRYEAPRQQEQKIVIQSDEKTTGEPEPAAPVRTKRKYSKRNVPATKQGEERLEDPSLTEDSLGGWLKKGSTRAILQQLNEKYPAGVPQRLYTLVLKHGTDELLHKKLNDVKEMDIRRLPRTGKVIWQAFLDAKNFKLP